MKQYMKRITQQWNELDTRKQILVKLIISALILGVAVVFFLLNKESFYGLNNNGVSVLLKKKTVLYLGCFMIYALCLFVKNPFGKFGNYMLNIHLMEWFPLVCFMVVETFLGVSFMQMKLYKVLFNVLIYMLIMYVFFAITASVRVSVIGVASVSVLFAVVNIYLVEFRQIPLLASDLTVLETAMNVASDFNFNLNIDVILLICFLIAVILLSMKIKQEKATKKQRIVIAVVFLCFFVWMYYFMVGSNQLKKRGIGLNTFRPIKSYRKNGALLTFVRSIKLMIVEEPEGYSLEVVEDITDDYASDNADSTDYMEPNVIVIMNEAFSDLQSVGNFETNQEVLPFYNSLEEDTVKGFAYVSVFGGQTANSEFEFLTGDSKAYLPQGGTPYQFYIKDYLPSLTGNLKIDGYQGLLALHPYNKSGYNRVNVYENMGFSDFITKADFDDAVLVRNHISDDANYDRIIEEYEKAKAKSDEPFYLFNVTMQNHSPYDTDYDNLPDTIQITTPECQDKAAQRYLNLVHLSDAATKELVEYFEQQDEPTVILMFGDHEPGLSNSFYEKIMGKHPDDLTDEESMELYKVPFFIWTNYDIEEQYIEKTSLNYLQSLMLDVAGMKLSGYNQYLLDLMKEVPAINASGYYGTDGSFYKVDNKKSPYYESLQEYQWLEYNHLFDSKRVDEFFELQE